MSNLIQTAGLDVIGNPYTELNTGGDTNWINCNFPQPARAVITHFQSGTTSNIYMSN